MTMESFRAWFLKSWRYMVAYTLFVVFVLIGLGVTWRLRANVLELALLFKVHPQITFVLHSWGSYLVFVPYVFFIALLEPYLNQAAKNKQLLTPVYKVGMLLAGVGIASVLISWLCTALSGP